MADWLTTWSVWHWLVLGFVLLIAETLVPGVFLLWWGLAAIVAAGVMALVPSLSLTVLAVFYAILAIILSLLWWKYQHSKDNQDQSRTTLNQRDHTLLGKKGTVLEIGSNGIGRGAFGDTTWRIQGEHLTVNDLVVVERVDGITLLVKKGNRMNHLIIFAHPNSQKSFGRAIVDRVVKASQQLGVETHLRDLYTMEFNPIISFEELQSANKGVIPAEIQQEHEFIRQADLITMVYPLWWMGFPAMLKGYLDRVLSHGFAYKTENGESKGLLQGKAMQQFITIGSSVAKYQEYGVDKSLNHCLINGLFNYCGIENVDYTLLGIFILSMILLAKRCLMKLPKNNSKIDRTFSSIVSTIIGKQQMSETQVNNFSLISRLFGNLFYRSPMDPNFEWGI